MLITLVLTAWRNFWRGGLFTLATVLITMVALFSVVIAFSLNLLWQETTRAIAQKLDITAEISEQAKPAAFDRLLQELRQHPAVKPDSIRFTSKDDALQRFRSRYQHRPEILSFLSVVGNPLYPSLTVTPVSLERREEVKTLLTSPAHAGDVVVEIKDDPLQQEQLNELTEFTRRANRGVWSLASIFFILTILIMANAIRLTIITRKDEISLMQLVGATPTFIKAPLLLEGIFYGLGATILLFFFLLPTFALIPAGFYSYFGFVRPSFSLFWSNFLLPLMGWLLPLAIITGLIASFISVRRYLRFPLAT